MAAFLCWPIDEIKSERKKMRQKIISKNFLVVMVVDFKSKEIFHKHNELPCTRKEDADNSSLIDNV
jgi:hypothetical protein